MAEGKKNVLIHSDWSDIFEALEDDEAGRLIKHFFRYINDDSPVAPDRITELSFIPIKRTLKANLAKWEVTREKRREAGRKGGKQTQANQASASNAKQIQANQADTVTVTVTETKEVDSTTPKGIDFDNLLKFINQTFGRSFRKINDSVKQKYKARIKEGYTSEDIREAIKNCKKTEYHIENNYKYCTPEFFSRAEKIDLHSSIGTPENSSDPMVNYVKQHIAKYGDS